MLRRRNALACAVLLAVSLGMVGCAGQAPGARSAATDTSSGEFNATDVMFARTMIPHHEQAVQMSDAILRKDGVDPQVRDLAEKIKGAQQPEIDQLREWLDGWNASESSDQNSHAGHGAGMMSVQDLAALDAATSAAAAQLFLEQMILHHEGAVQMAETEAIGGDNPAAQEMASAIIATQTAEIQHMRDLIAP
jgi:uncharacterized protein (DUF305 family)